MKSKTAEYMCWANMKQRCYNERNDRFPDYGGRGRGRHKTSKGDKRGRPAKTFLLMRSGRRVRLHGTVGS